MIETITLAHHIAGNRREGAAAFAQDNPARADDLHVEGPEADAALVAEVVDAARQAVEALAAAGIEARADALARIGRTLGAEADRIALLIARETGKTLGDSKGEVMRAARLFDFFAGETLRNAGERFASTRPGAIVEVDHVPVGVVAAITPWNFPIAIPAWKIAPALAYGNAVLWKPSEIASATADALMAVIAGAGLPDGSVNMLLGMGDAGRAIVEADGVDAVSFTGSVATGARVRAAAAERGARVQLEMGGVNGLIVMADADLDNAVDCAVNGAFFAAGQRCTATSRMIVGDAIADRFIDAVRERVAALKIGDPTDAATQVGPLAAPHQKETIARQVAAVEASGAKPVFGGSGAAMEQCFYAPTLFDCAAPEGTLGQEEIFGPVAGVFRVSGFDEAMTVLNGNRFGLSAGICTRSLLHAEEFKRRARAGMKMVNLPTAGVDYHAPFGGVADSSYGPREQGRAARAFYTNMTTSYVKAL
ncbi:aldehyde dehydrogenase family protein [Allosphingosinicella indica]|uniref:2,5-dioxopentanoate dehydrogenase (NAD+) n=1 Tax=Allosphingosinicella indica TaxID=941907 RepID=A0A1X7FY78_9SPHN|nr:aldehyde dehydrogenase family protein [Allosphingosinicella indica]SMF60825.1 2,5-dioxopentanoate dehydrogenase (NAD+) [Allosphingosinicella indica]